MKIWLLFFSLLASASMSAQDRPLGTDTLALEGITVYSTSQNELFSKDSLSLFQELTRMHESDQKFRKNSNTFMEHINEQNAIDSMNTLRLVQITEQYGFPSSRRFRSKRSTLSPHIIWVHANAQHWATLKPIVEKEYKAGHMSQPEYAHIMWHLNGRKGVPEFEGAKMKKKRNGKVVQRMKNF